MREGTLTRIDNIGRLVVPVLFILLLPVAFAASVKNDDRVDNAFAFEYDADADEIVSATSSIRGKFGDDVQFTVFVTQGKGRRPLLGRLRFDLLTDRAVRYAGTIDFEIVDESRRTAFENDRSVRFTLRPKSGKRVHKLKMPFDLDKSGYYSVKVTFSR